MIPSKKGEKTGPIGGGYGLVPVKTIISSAESYYTRVLCRKLWRVFITERMETCRLGSRHSVESRYSPVTKFLRRANDPCVPIPLPPTHTHTLVEARPLEIDFKLRSLQGPWWRCSIRRPGVPTIRGSRNVGKTGWETGDDGWWVGGWWWWRYRQFLLWNVSDDSVYRVKLREISFFRDVWLC